MSLDTADFSEGWFSGGGRGQTAPYCKVAPNYVNSHTVVCHATVKIIAVGLAIFVENENVTDWFTSANATDFQEYICVSVTKTKSTQIEISYATGMTSYCF